METTKADIDTTDAKDAAVAADASDAAEAMDAADGPTATDVEDVAVVKDDVADCGTEHPRSIIPSCQVRPKSKLN